MPPILPPALQATLARTLNTSLRAAILCQGGMVNRAARLETSDGACFVKWNSEAPPGLFACEARSLDNLRAANAIRVPQVLAHEESSPEGAPPFLVLEWIEPQAPSDEDTFARRFGREVAELHRHHGEVFGDGRTGGNYLGIVPQRNEARTTWPDFWRDCRLMPLLEATRAKGQLPPVRHALLMNVIDKLEILLDGHNPRPSLLHGDLWSGNFCSMGAQGEQPVIFDPAVYWGSREAEIAYVELFGDFPPAFLPAYHDAFPLDDGYARRRPLHQLYPLLVHLLHFGEIYGPRLEATCRAALNV